MAQVHDNTQYLTATCSKEVDSTSNESFYGDTPAIRLIMKE